MNTTMKNGNIEGVLNRSEMKNIMAGSETCHVSVTCPNGITLECWSDSGNCYSEGDGTITGSVNCNTGAVKSGCWQHDPEWDQYPEYQG